MQHDRSVQPRVLRKVGLWGTCGFIVLAAAIQFVPYGRDRTPAPAPNPFRWHAPEAEALAKAACYDCHSSETRWWWAVKVAPFSWLAQRDIDHGKHHVNFSAWNGRLTPAGMQRALDRNMPPWYYTAVHPEARLNDAQKQILVRGFQASLTADAGGGESPDLVQASYHETDAAAIINVRCSQCHTPRRALDFRASSPAKAKALIDRMIRHGARVPASAEPVLVRHFTS